MLKEECKHISAAKLVSYMEKQKSLLRKLKRQKHEEAKHVNHQFKVDAGQVYPNMGEALNKDKENERPNYTLTEKKNAERKMFENIEDASSFWRPLWKSQGTRNRNAQWLEDIRSAIYSRLPPPSEKTCQTPWKPQKYQHGKKNWTTPDRDPDRLTNVLVEKVFYEDVAMAFQTIANTNIVYPAWFSEGKTKLLPKPGEFTMQ